MSDGKGYKKEFYCVLLPIKIPIPITSIASFYFKGLIFSYNFPEKYWYLRVLMLRSRAEISWLINVECGKLTFYDNRFTVWVTF